MRKLYFLILGLLFCNVLSAQIVSFTSDELRTRILLTASPTVHIAKNLVGNWTKIDTNNDGQIQTTEADNISYLDLRVYQNMANTFYISSLVGLESFHNLQTLYCGNPYDTNNIVTRVNSIDLSGLSQLRYLDCSSILYLASVNTTGCDNLETFNCAKNGSYVALDVSNKPSLKYLNCSSTNMNSMNFSGTTNLVTFDCSYTRMTTLDLNSQAFLTSLNCSHINSNGFPFNLNVAGCASLQSIDASYLYMNGLNLSNLSDLETITFTNNYNNTANVFLTIAACTALKTLDCNNSYIGSINASGLANLEVLNCSYTNATYLNITGCQNLISLNCNATNLTSYTVANYPNLTTLDFALSQYLPNNSLTITNCPSLQTLTCNERGLNLLNIIGCPNLQTLDCSKNKFTALHLENLSGLQTLNCQDITQLVSLFIKNDADEVLSIANNPNLAYICADDSQIGALETALTQAGNANCTVNSYCSFVPGGTYYSITGTNHVDSNNNGCNDLDLSIPYLKYVVETNNIPVGTYLSNHLGDYTIPVQAGSYSVVALLENPSYYSISSVPGSINFPAMGSPYNLDLCLTPVGNHPDVEATILPLNTPRPNTNVTYKIVYKNKGTTTQSGTVNLVFDNPVLDMVSSNPVVSTTGTNSLQWNFTNLLPFETRKILLTFNLNSPTETPAVDSGYALQYNGTITTAALDETPNDNTFVLNQTVVNSFDPNDKTCLEGNTITPEMVGKEVHYMIRFENNGTANAENVVVKDIIDTTKFDITSLIPIDGSHPFLTRISAGNKVEFIFENINLPFDDANNDGYVVFKIKTKPTLVLGDTFSNTASIYFDYNFPIITNNATTTVAVLANQDFAFERYIAIHPNPAQDVLNIDFNKEIAVSSYNIYNTLGQLVLVILNAQQVKSIDVSSLKTGNYFLKVNSDKGSSSVKFVKL